MSTEIKQHFDAQDEGNTPFTEATDYDIQHILERLAGANEHGAFVDEPTSYAGHWYRSLWNADGRDTTTYEQQWQPFLRRCHMAQKRSEKDSRL